jgi:hypothetical protein
MSDIAINPVTRRVQFTGNTGTGPYAFTFNILVDGDIAVFKGTTELTLTTDYTVTINANGTGSITLTVALISSDVLTIIGGRELSRTTDFVTAGDLLASSLNEQLDSNVIMTQQLDEKLGRGLFVNPGDVFTDLELPLKDDRKGTVLGFNETTGDPEPGPTLSDVDSLATISADIKTLAEIQDGTVATDAITNVNTIRTDVTTVSGISSNVTTVAGNTSNINTVAGNDANITTVAGIDSDVTTVSGISSDVTTVAADGADIGVVAGLSSDIITVSGVSTEIGLLGTADAVSDMNTLAVAGIIADMDSLADNVGAISIVSDDIGYVIAVAINAANINTVAADGADIGTVATSIASVNTAATNIASINTNATNITDIQNASANAATATTQAGIATTQAGIATTKASEASASEVAAEAAKVAAEAALDEFTDIYLGAKASDPTTDNDGNALTAGDQYFNTTINVLKIYNGSAWQSAAIDSSGFVETTGDTMTGALDVQSTITADGLTVETGTTSKITVSENTGSGTASIDFVATAAFPKTKIVTDVAAGDLYLETLGNDRLKIANNGDINFYATDGITQAFHWDAADESLGIGVTSPSLELSVDGDIWQGNRSGVEIGRITNAAGWYDFGGSSNVNGAQMSHVGTLRFLTASTERLRIDASGNVGIGTSPTAFGGGFIVSETSGSSGGYSLQSSGAVVTQIAADSTASVGYTGTRSNHPYVFTTNNAERMRIDSSGKLSLTASDQGIQIGPDIAAYTIKRDSNGLLNFRATQANFNGYIFDTVDGERMRIDSSGSVGIGTSSITSGFKMEVIGDARFGDVYNDDAVELGWSAGGSAGFVQAYDRGASAFRDLILNNAVTIDSSGNLLVGTTSATSRSGVTAKTVSSASGQDAVYAVSNSNSHFTINSHVTTTSGTRYHIGFGDGTTWTERGTISTNGTSTTYATSSDYRLKTDAQPMTGASARVQALNPVNFEWIADGTRVDGFLAHEAQEVVPEAVTGTKDAVDADGNPEYQGIDQSKLVPLLTAALQEALTKIDALETRITALEG